MNDDLPREPLGDQRGIEPRAREYLPVGLEEDAGAAAAGGADLLEAARRLAPGKRLLPFGAVAPHPRHPLLAERVHHRGADPVETAGVVVALGLELPARVQRGEDQLERGLLVLR